MWEYVCLGCLVWLVASVVVGMGVAKFLSISKIADEQAENMSHEKEY